MSEFQEKDRLENCLRKDFKLPFLFLYFQINSELVWSFRARSEFQKSDEEMCIVLDNLEEKFKHKLQYAARIDLHFRMTNLTIITTRHLYNLAYDTWK